MNGLNFEALWRLASRKAARDATLLYPRWAKEKRLDAFYRLRAIYLNQFVRP